MTYRAKWRSDAELLDRPSRDKSAAMLPPPKPDPLMAAIGAVELASHSDVEIPDPPYPTHEETDRAIAEQER